MGKKRTMPIEPLTRSERDSLMQACGKGPAGLRNRALLAAFGGGGLRVGEAVALLPKDLELDEGRIHVLRGKGAKRRVVAVDAGSAAIISAWIEERKRLGISSKAPLFCTISRGSVLQPGRPLLPSYVRSLMKRLARRAGVEKRVHAHGLRHTHTRELDEDGLPLGAIRDQLGHSSASTTNGYLQSYSAAERVEMIRARGEAREAV